MKQFKIHYPVDLLIKTQDFGVTGFLDYYKNNGVILSGHNGIDYAAPYGLPIRASHDGLAYYEVDAKQGHGVVIRTETDDYEYEGKQVAFKTIYWHMIDGNKDPKYKSPLQGVVGGRKVKTGDIIGYPDSTGLSTGNHLHFGLKPVAKGEPTNTWYNLEQNNGMYGAINPNPYFTGQYASQSFTAPFKFDMRYGDTGDEITRLQRFLSRLGYFKGDFFPRYGSITQGAVYGFQLDHVSLSLYERIVMRGRVCGPKTRDAINKVIERLT